MSKHVPPSQGVSVERLRAALETVAELVTKNEAFLPVFIRLEKELKVLEADNPLERARAIARQKEAQAQFKEYVQETAGSGTDADELAKLHGLKESGALTDSEYQSMKAKIVG